MYYDKMKAKSGKWRVPEYKLFLVALIGGASGMYLAMRVFRHKTLHLKFSIGIPVIIIFNILIFYTTYGIFFK
jgi:uncharacterized membrane protein YsdA (DUF1294 family)